MSDIHDPVPDNHRKRGLKNGGYVRIIATGQLAEIIMLPPWDEFIVCLLTSDGMMKGKAVVCHPDEVLPLNACFADLARVAEDQLKKASMKISAADAVAKEELFPDSEGKISAFLAYWEKRGEETLKLPISKPHIKAGDVVRLKSGGPQMTAGTRKDQSVWHCQWFVGDALQDSYFDEAGLAKVSQ